MVEITKIKLDKTDRKILAELDKNCRIPSTALAKKVMKSRQAVEYRIEQMVKKGIITGFNASINPAKTGYKVYKVYLQLRNVPEERKRLFDYLRKCGKVYWMGETDGVWDIIFAFFAKTDYDFFGIKNEVMSSFRSIILKEYGDILVDVKQFPKMYFTSMISEPTMFAGAIAETKMDGLDHKILEIVVKNARAPVTEIANETGSTPAIVRGRLKMLEESGVIIQYRIGVDLRVLGLEMYKAIIKLDSYSEDDQKKLLSYVSQIPNAQYFIRNLWQIEAELVVGSYDEYYNIINKLKMNFPFVIKTVESVIMKTDEWTPGFRNLLMGKDE